MKRFCWYCGREADAEEVFCRDDGQRIVVEDQLSGRLLAGRYKLHGVFGGGGFGHVYVAVVEGAPPGSGLEPGAPVAVKLIERRGMDAGAWRKRQVSHEREAKTARSVAHPGLLKVYDAGEERGGLLYTVMPLGRRDLKTILAGQGPGSAQYSAGRWLGLANGYAAQACGAVAALHARGIYHRDIKPANLMELDGPGKAVLIDYGIARHEEDGTATGTLEGFVSLEYLCPEFFTSVDGRVDAALRDQYALGATLYELYTGRPPFTAAEIGAKRNLGEAPMPPRARNPELPEAVEGLILRALAKRPQERFQGVATMDAALTRALKPQRPRATAPAPEPEPAPRPAPEPAPAGAGRVWLLAGILGVAGAAAFGYFAWQERSRQFEEQLAAEQRQRAAAESAAAQAGERLASAEAARARERAAVSRSGATGGRVAPGKAGIQWVSIPGGSFIRGSDSGASDEKPVHRVTVEAFQISKTEVTNRQYQACVEAGACRAAATWCGSDLQGDDQPVVCVDWNQAKAFSEWAGGRLPSEAEWEYAARSAGKDYKHPWGNEPPTCARAVISDDSAGGNGCGRKTTWPVCSKPAGNTEQGLCDMAGNALEWTQDWYHSSYDGAPTDGSAWESPAGPHRVLRGGSRDSRFAAYAARSANRSSLDPGVPAGDQGFRPAR